MSEPAFPAWAFRRLDEDPDPEFYSFPRFVVHIDAGAIGALTGLYRQILPPRARVLDLMASWRSHLPAEFVGTVIGLGLNADEMADNPQLDAAVVHDVNAEPRLPFAAETFDAVVCAVSVQYLSQPVAVFHEVRRTLRRGGPFVVSFSNRCFPDKAVALWRATEDAEHVEVVRAYFVASGSPDGGWSPVAMRSWTPADGDPLFAVWATRSGSATHRAPHPFPHLDQSNESTTTR